MEGYSGSKTNQCRGRGNWHEGACLGEGSFDRDTESGCREGVRILDKEWSFGCLLVQGAGWMRNHLSQLLSSPQSKRAASEKYPVHTVELPWAGNAILNRGERVPS